MHSRLWLAGRFGQLLGNKVFQGVAAAIAIFSAGFASGYGIRPMLETQQWGMYFPKGWEFEDHAGYYAFHLRAPDAVGAGMETGRFAILEASEEQDRLTLGRTKGTSLNEKGERILKPWRYVGFKTDEHLALAYTNPDGPGIGVCLLQQSASTWRGVWVGKTTDFSGVELGPYVVQKVRGEDPEAMAMPQVLDEIRTYLGVDAVKLYKVNLLQAEVTF